MTEHNWTPEELTLTEGIFFLYFPNTTYQDTTAREIGEFNSPIKLVLNQAGYHKISSLVVQNILTSSKL